MKIKRQNHPVPKLARKLLLADEPEEALMEEAVFEESAIAEPEPAEKETLPKNHVRVIALADLLDDGVYGVYCYGVRQFGCLFRPGLGLSIRRLGEAGAKDRSAVPYVVPGTSYCQTGSLHRAPKGSFLVRMPGSEICHAMINWTEPFEEPADPEGGQRFFYSVPTAKEKRVAELYLRRLKEKIKAKAEKPKTRKPAFKIRFKS